MSSFTGLYVQRLNSGEISGVYVLDATGTENALDPNVYTQSGIQPPIEQLPDLVEYNQTQAKTFRKSERQTLLSVVGWVTFAAVVVALITAALSVLNDCYGVAHNSEQCLWSQALFPVTSGLFFVIAWPICFTVGVLLRWWKGINNA